MKTKAVRMYGKEDLRLEVFDLPELKDGKYMIREAGKRMAESE